MNYLLLLTILFIGVAIIIVLSKYRYDEMTKLSFWSSRNKDRHAELIQMLDIMKDKFDRVNIEWYLIAGGLLGAVRNNKLIPWDDDLDIGIRYNTESDRKRYIKLILSLYEDDENVIVTEETILNPLKILNKNNGVFIDIFFYTNISDDIIHSSNSKDRLLYPSAWFRNSELDNKSSVTLYGKEYRCPSNTVNTLKRWYGDDCIDTFRVTHAHDSLNILDRTILRLGHYIFSSKIREEHFQFIWR